MSVDGDADDYFSTIVEMRAVTCPVHIEPGHPIRDEGMEAVGISPFDNEYLASVPLPVPVLVWLNVIYQMEYRSSIGRIADALQLLGSVALRQHVKQAKSSTIIRYRIVVANPLDPQHSQPARY